MTGSPPDHAIGDRLDPDEVFDAIACLAGRAREVTPLPGGLTNRNFRVRTATHDVVVRISPPTSGLLAVDREAEYHNTVVAAAGGVGAAVVDYLPGRGVLVVAFIPDAMTYAESDVPANLARVAGAVRALHSGAAFVNRFDIFDIQRRYLALIRHKGFRLPEGYEELLGAAAAMESALGQRPEPLAPCHNDLLAANFLDDGTRVRIIDYEYSGSNAPGFELGNLAQESHLTDDQLAELVAAYRGREDPDLTARARVWGIASAYAWTLWGAIQDGIAPEDYDFWGWGVEKFDRARTAITGRSFGALLDMVGRGP
ncbi:MAG: phosphotransferase [Dermatophilaceae bacterium]